ncbi:patatin-domain-containing protein [Xylariaceae sp. FL0594]|nr:patatin-domain-containing protein [Xylariaceae sp. FL0594]
MTSLFSNLLPSALPSAPPIHTSRAEPLSRIGTDKLKLKSQLIPPKSSSSASSSSSALPSIAGSASKVVDGFLYLKDGLSRREREERRLRDERRQILHARMQNAETFKVWDAAAHELDMLEGNEEWKADVNAGDYNPDVLQMRLKELDDARSKGDTRAMMHLIRTALSRDLGGMGNIDLYRHSYCGTKQLIERYVDSALQTIAALVDRSALHSSLSSDPGPRDLLDSMLYARQSFGRSALLLSGGGTFGMTHIGVLKALFEAKLLPRIISGASAGSIVCAVICAKTDDEIPQVIKDFPHGDLAVFEEQGNEDGFLDHLRRLLTEGNWSDIRHLTRVMRDLLGDITFQEAYNRTRRICNICVSTASIYELPRLLNYVTAPNVMLWSAVAASCSVPIVFSAGALLVKNPLTGEHSPWNPTPQMWIDGSVDNDLPMVRLAEMFNVNHFIVSQVNPHVVPFLAKDDTPNTPVGNHRSDVYKSDSDWLRTVTSLAKSEAIHRMQFMAELGILPTTFGKLRSILSQKYAGDINILPAIGVSDLPNVLRNPTAEFMTRSCLLGERATWPKLARIRDRCAIELALDRAVHALRARVVFSKSQVDLRRLATGSIPKKGSHEPLLTSKMPSQIQVDRESCGGSSGSTGSDEQGLRNNRRSSGSNLANNRPSRFHYDDGLAYDSPYKVTDDDDDDDGEGEEEKLEISSSRGKPRMRMRMRMRLEKLPNREDVLLVSGPRTGPAGASSSSSYLTHATTINGVMEPNGFDFDGRQSGMPAATAKANLEASVNDIVTAAAVHENMEVGSLNGSCSTADTTTSTTTTTGEQISPA